MSWRFCTCSGLEGRGRLAMMVTAALTAGALMFGTPARAQTDHHQQEGVTLRLIALPPDADGRLRGALSVELDPGWKTYWIAPGPVGLAPRLDFAATTGAANVQIALPVPVRFAEGSAQSIGYDQSLAIPIRADAAGPSAVLRVDAFLGVCREICVPVQATLAAAPTRNLTDRALVARAEAAAPAGTGPLTVKAATWSADRSMLLVETGSPVAQPPVDAFVSAGDGWSFGEPASPAFGDTSVLAIPVLARPSGSADLRSIDVLLTQGEIAQLSPSVPIAPR